MRRLPSGDLLPPAHRQSPAGAYPVTTRTLPPRPSPDDVRALDAVVRYRAALDAHRALAALILVERDLGRPVPLDLAGPIVLAERGLDRATRALRGHLERSGLVHDGLAYLADHRGGIATVPVKVLDGRVVGRLPGLEAAADAS